MNCKTIIIPDTVTRVDKNAFIYYDNILVSLPNSTTSQVQEWFNNDVFGDGSTYEMRIAEYTITCKDGILHALGKMDFMAMVGIGWDITITSF
jgi:hypothetical protein